MSALTEENRPHSCFALGLECESCVEASARQVAAICQTLGGSRASDVFFQIFADPACAGMRPRFEAAYRQAAELAEELPRKPVIRAPQRTPSIAVAVA